MKKALINDWYYVNGGAEKVIHSLNQIWDDFDHFALIDFLNENDRTFILNGKKAKTTFIQNLPTVKSNHRKFLQLFPFAIQQFNLREYEIILSSSSSIAKGVRTTKNQLHICYCHSPLRNAWDLQEQYLDDAGLIGLKRAYEIFALHKIKKWDIANSHNVSFFIANSKCIAQRIKAIYNREATVIYPPVDVDFFSLETQKEAYYFTASRMVSYKKIQLIVETFNELPHLQLIVAGDGPEFQKIQKEADEKARIEAENKILEESKVEEVKESINNQSEPQKEVLEPELVQEHTQEVKNSQKLFYGVLEFEGITIAEATAFRKFLDENNIKFKVNKSEVK